MMRRIRVLLCAAFLLPLSGCLEIDTKVLVNADGSGTLTERFVLKGPMARMIQRMGSDASSVVDRAKAEKRARELGRGVKVTSVEPLREGEGVGAVAVFTFEDVNGLQLNANPTVSQDAKSAPAIATSSTPITFSFERGPPAVLTVAIGTMNKARQSADKQPEVDVTVKPPAMIKQIFKGMRIAITVGVAGQIIETNATWRDGNSVTLVELDFDTILANPDGFKALQSQSDSAAQDMKSALQSIPGVKVEPQAEVKIVFVAQTMASNDEHYRSSAPQDAMCSMRIATTGSVPSCIDRY